MSCAQVDGSGAETVAIFVEVTVDTGCVTVDGDSVTVKVDDTVDGAGHVDIEVDAAVEQPKVSVMVDASVTVAAGGQDVGALVVGPVVVGPVETDVIKQEHALLNLAALPSQFVSHEGLLAVAVAASEVRRRVEQYEDALRALVGFCKPRRQLSPLQARGMRTCPDTAPASSMKALIVRSAVHRFADWRWCWQSLRIYFSHGRSTRRPRG